LGAFLGAWVAAFVKVRVVRLVVLGVLLLAAATPRLVGGFTGESC